jgi:hypothetical protein
LPRLVDGKHVVDLALGVRRLMIDFPRGEAVDACAEHPRAEELPPLIACGACRIDDLVELNGHVVRLGHRRMVCRLVGNDVDDGRCSFRVIASARSRGKHMPGLERRTGSDHLCSLPLPLCARRG